MRITVEWDGKPAPIHGRAFKPARAVASVEVKTGQATLRLSRADLSAMFAKIGAGIEWAGGRVRLLEPADLNDE